MSVERDVIDDERRWRRRMDEGTSSSWKVGESADKESGGERMRQTGDPPWLRLPQGCREQQGNPGLAGRVSPKEV